MEVNAQMKPYISGAQRPARDELSSGPPYVSSRKSDYFRIRSAENGKCKAKTVLDFISSFRSQHSRWNRSSSNSQKAKNILFISILSSHICISATNQDIDTERYMYFRMSEPLIVIFCYFKDCGQCRQHTQVYADCFVVVPMDYIFVTRYHYRNLLIFSHLMQCMFLSETKLFWPLIRLSTCDIWQSEDNACVQTNTCMFDAPLEAQLQ